MYKYFSGIGFLILILFLSACSPKPVVVQGKAMMPTFDDGDRIMIDQNLGELKRGEVITHLFPRDTSKWFIKRIIGLPGEKIEIVGGKVFINGRILDEPYVDESFNQNKMDMQPKMIPENHYFVMGDNRDNSSDSRYWGTLPKELVTGKYHMTYLKVKE